MPEDLTGLGRAVEAVGKVADSKIAHRLYDDALRNPISEVSGVCTDVLKGLRLFTTPFVLAANHRVRLLECVEEVRNRVPEEHQVEAAPEIAGPVFERLRFLERDNLLTELYLQILTNAIDERSADNVHPAFVEILGQLSRDEALILLYLKSYGQLRAIYSGEFDTMSRRCSRVRVEHVPAGLEDLNNPHYLFDYLMRMAHLSLTDWPHLCDDVYRLDCGRPTECLCVLAQFGERFVDACIPDDIPNGVRRRNSVR